MANQNRRSGMIQFKAGSQVYQAVGVFSYNLGTPVRSAVVGSDEVHGFDEKPQVPFIEGEVRDGQKFSVKTLTLIEDETVTLNLFQSAQGAGKIITLSHAWYANEGTAKTDGVIPVRFEAKKADEKLR